MPATVSSVSVASIFLDVALTVFILVVLSAGIAFVVSGRDRHGYRGRHQPNQLPADLLPLSLPEKSP
ncbi:hypothetical protein HJC99_03475 [Candidatus Saccharibacteria bacterium]|nr:hypothetical protein [Candidatus Saccharibacteria bacterium]